MKQYTTPEQTAKLIELGFEPSTRIPFEVGNDELGRTFSIGELLSFLPPIIPQESGYYINITHDSVSWVIDYKQHGDTQYKYIVSDVELIDALFDMVVKLKEEKVI